MTEDLSTVLGEAGLDGDELGYDEIVALCGLIGLDPEDPIVGEFADEIARLGGATWTDDGTAPDAYAFRIGTWRIGIEDQGIRTGILTAMVAAALLQRGFDEFSIGMVTAVLPTVLEVERIELDAADRRMLLDLRLNEAARTGYMTIDELYQLLPDSARTTVNRYDFANFVDRLRDAGLVDGEHDWLQTRDPDDRRPLLRWR